MTDHSPLTTDHQPRIAAAQESRGQTITPSPVSADAGTPMWALSSDLRALIVAALDQAPVDAYAKLDVVDERLSTVAATVADALLEAGWGPGAATYRADAEHARSQVEGLVGRLRDVFVLARTPVMVSVPPEPPIGTSFVHKRTGLIEWVRSEDGQWRCGDQPRPEHGGALCDSCPADWVEVAEAVDGRWGPYVVRVLPGERLPDQLAAAQAQACACCVSSILPVFHGGAGCVSGLNEGGCGHSHAEHLAARGGNRG